jgi:hypothetical protein
MGLFAMRSGSKLGASNLLPACPKVFQNEVGGERQETDLKICRLQRDIMDQLVPESTDGKPRTKNFAQVCI